VIRAVRSDLGVSVNEGSEQRQVGLEEVIQLIVDDPHPKKVMVVSDASRVARSETLGADWFVAVMGAGAQIEVAGDRRYRNTQEDFGAWRSECGSAAEHNYNQGNGTALGIAMRRLNGLPHGQFPYALGRDSGNGVRFLPHLSLVIKKFFSLANTGTSINDLIAVGFEDEWWYRFYGSHGYESQKDSIQRILHNPVYAGLVPVGDDPEVVAAGRFECIIPIEDFVSVQHQLPPRTPSHKEDFYLRDWLICATCRKRMRWSSVRLRSTTGQEFAHSDVYTCGVHGCRPKQLVEREFLHNQIHDIAPLAAWVRGDMDLATSWEEATDIDRFVLVKELFPNRIVVDRGVVVPTARIQRLLSSPNSNATIAQETPT